MIFSLLLTIVSDLLMLLVLTLSLLLIGAKMCSTATGNGHVTVCTLQKALPEGVLDVLRRCSILQVFAFVIFLYTDGFFPQFQRLRATS